MAKTIGNTGKYFQPSLDQILAEARNLRVLELEDAGITEEGIASLSSLSQLSSLTVWGHEIDRETERVIEASLPDTLVIVGPVRNEHR